MSTGIDKLKKDFFEKKVRRSKLKKSYQREIVRAYCENTSARAIAEILKINRNTVSLYYRKIRDRLLWQFLFESSEYLLKYNSHRTRLVNSQIHELFGELDYEFSLIPTHNKIFDFHLLPRSHQIWKKEKKEIRISIPRSDDASYLSLGDIKITSGPLNDMQYNSAEIREFKDGLCSRLSQYRGIQSSNFLYLLSESMFFESNKEEELRIIFIFGLMDRFYDCDLGVRYSSSNKLLTTG